MLNASRRVIRGPAGLALAAMLLVPLLLGGVLERPAAALEPRALSMGVSADRREAHPEYPLKVVFAESGSGAYLALVQVIVKDADGRIVMSVEDAGPWLYLDLAPGRYTVEAVRQDRSRQQGTVRVGGWQRELILYWPTS